MVVAEALGNPSPEEEALIAQVRARCLPIIVYSPDDEDYTPLVISQRVDSPEAQYILNQLIDLHQSLSIIETNVRKRIDQEVATLKRVAKEKGRPVKISIPGAMKAQLNQDPRYNELVLKRSLLEGRAGDSPIPIALERREIAPGKPKILSWKQMGMIGDEKEAIWWTIILSSEEAAMSFLDASQIDQGRERVKELFDLRWEIFKGKRGMDDIQRFSDDYYDRFIAEDEKKEQALWPMVRAISEEFSRRTTNP